ncbi:MAG: sugar-binding domain-containing protein, partial [Erysipelotrichaceae bacterium]
MRTIIQLNQNWQFTKEQTVLPSTYPTTWQTVDLPHTWNANDGQDGNGSYYRGTCWYAKSFPTPITRASQRVYIEVLAASQSGRVFVNGKEVAYHEGGYSRFRADISEHLVDDMENLIAIEVDNSPSDVIYPQMADFTFYGGLYRGVNLIVVDEVHFSLDHYGAPGIMATPRIKEGGAEIELVTWIEDANEDYTVRYVIRDQEGTIVSETWRPATQPSVVEWLDSPHLWQGVEDPYLYTITATLVRRNQTIDEITTKVGIREFYVDANKG